VAPSIEPDRIRRIVFDCLGGKASAARFQVVETPARDVLANSDFGFVKSGTSTLEAALTGTPFLITYKISSISWHLGSILIRSPYKGLVNLIAGEEIVPEYLQAEATPEALSRTALEYLENPEKGAAMQARLLRVCSRLGARQASEAAASAIMSLL